MVEVNISLAFLQWVRG